MVGGGGKGKYGVRGDTMRRAVSFAAPMYYKLKCVLSMMDLKLADIVRKWSEGELQHGGLSVEEVRRLVLALFEDTEYRRE